MLKVGQNFIFIQYDMKLLNLERMAMLPILKMKKKKKKKSS